MIKIQNIDKYDLKSKEWQKAKFLRQKYFFDKTDTKYPYSWTFTDPKHQYFVLFNDNNIIGYMHIQLWPDKRAALRIIVIDEKERKKNYGSKFLLAIERWLKNHQYESLHTESNKKALKFYKNNGYTEMPFNDPDGCESYPSDTPLGKNL